MDQPDEERSTQIIEYRISGVQLTGFEVLRPDGMGVIRILLTTGGGYAALLVAEDYQSRHTSLIVVESEKVQMLKDRLEAHAGDNKWLAKAWDRMLEEGCLDRLIEP